MEEVLRCGKTVSLRLGSKFGNLKKQLGTTMMYTTPRETYRNSRAVPSPYCFVNRILNRIGAMSLLLFAATLSAAAQTSVLTQLNDISRTGQNTGETILITS